MGLENMFDKLQKVQSLGLKFNKIGAELEIALDEHQTACLSQNGEAEQKARLNVHTIIDNLMDVKQEMGFVANKK